MKRLFFIKVNIFLFLFFIIFQNQIKAKPDESSSKLLIISLDGFPAFYLKELIENGTLKEEGGILSIIKNGLYVKENFPTIPSLTAPSHATIITGTSPSQHGILSNNFHRINENIQKGVNGFDIKLESEPIWESAISQGKKVGIISFPHAKFNKNSSSSLWGIEYGKKLSEPFLKRYKLDDLKKIEEFKHLKIDSYSPPYYTNLKIKYNKDEEKLLQLYFIDSTDDEKSNYDQIIIDDDLNFENGYLNKNKEGDSIPYSFQYEEKLVGLWIKIVEFKEDLSQILIYVGPLCYNKGYPESFVDEINKKVGFWPGEPDYKIFDKKELPPELYVEQGIRLFEFLKNVTLYSMKHINWDLLLTYQPLIDEMGHQFLLKDTQNPDYNNKELREKYLKFYNDAYLKVDDYLKELWNEIDKNTTSLIAISDHGMKPIHSIIYPNRILKEADFNTSGKYALVRAYTSGPLVHIYFNKKGREEDGILDDDFINKHLPKLVQLFSEIKDPKTGEKLFETIITQEQKATVHFDHKNSGDIILLAKGGYACSSSDNLGDIVEPAKYSAQHGYDPRQYSEVRGIFFGGGKGLKKGVIEQIDSLELVALFSNLLGIIPPPSAKKEISKDIKNNLN